MAAPSQSPESTRSFDVIIIGAGVSGLNSAYRIQTELPGATYTLLEERDNLGGTWDLFKYPGVRSDSDLFTYGFAWRLWPYKHPIAEGQLLKSYLWDSMNQYAIPDHIRFGHHVTAAHWSSKSQRWILKVDHQGEPQHFQARFIVMATGYYDYKTPLKAVIPGIENFQGKVIHPQFWPTDYDYSDKRIAIIGSGATAVTLLPELAKKAARVTMVQRTPGYILSLKNRTLEPHWLWKHLPLSFVAPFERIKRMLNLYMFTTYCHYFPEKARAILREMTVPQLPDWIDYDTHFSPSYTPWQQRLCITPDGDFFQSLRDRKADVVTGKIGTVTSSGIQMEDGTAVDADVIVTATGLNIQLGGSIDFRVDGEAVAWGQKLIWNGAMIEGVPNLNFQLGYANASWTLGVDNSTMVFIRIIKLLDRKGLRAAVPRAPPEARSQTSPMFTLSSRYLTLAESRSPRWGSTRSWRPATSPPLNWLHAVFGNITRDLEFQA